MVPNPVPTATTFHRATAAAGRRVYLPAFFSRLASFFSFGVLVGNFLTFFLASWLLLMKGIVVDALIECEVIGIWDARRRMVPVNGLALRWVQGSRPGHVVRDLLRFIIAV